MNHWPRYVKQRVLGEGGYGKVFEAIDTATHTRVAIKELQHHYNPDVFRRFVREARILAQEAANPHVVLLLDADLKAQPPYLVLELCEHGSLRRKTDRPNPWREVAIILNHALRGLRDLHARGGFHRDLKPDNLLVATNLHTGHRVVKIADYGLARVPLTRTPMTRGEGGTEGYKAPEIMAGKAFTAAADIFSLGVTGLELLTGTRDPADLAIAQAPDVLKALLREMFDPNPRQRPTTSQIEEKLADLLDQDEQIRQARVAPPQEERGGFGDLLVGGLMLGGAIAAIGAVAAGIGSLIDSGGD